MSSYQIYQFAGVALPEYNQEQDLSTGSVDSTLLASVGGTFDVWANTQRAPRSQKIMVSGVYAPDGPAYIVDHAGNTIVDHAGNSLIAGTTQTLLRGEVEAIRALLGLTGRLVRRRWDDANVVQWRLARLLAVNEKSDVKDRTVMANVDTTFETAQPYWRDAAADVVNGNLVAGGAVGLQLGSEGNATIDDSTFTVTAASTITSLVITCAALGVDLRYTGTLAAGAQLVIDCGPQTVTVNGGAAYGGFALGSGHTARGWLPLPPGAWALLVSSNGAGTVSVSHFDQWV